MGRVATGPVATNCGRRLAGISAAQCSASRARSCAASRRTQHVDRATRVRDSLVQPAGVARSRASPQSARARVRRCSSERRGDAFRIRSVSARRRRTCKWTEPARTRGHRHGSLLVLAHAHRRDPRSGGDALAAATSACSNGVRIAVCIHRSSRDSKRRGRRSAAPTADADGTDPVSHPAEADAAGACDPSDPAIPAVSATPAIPAVPAVPPTLRVDPKP